MDTDLVRELVLTTTNDGAIYRSRITPVIANLRRKIKRGVYDDTLALKLWEYVALDGIAAYRKAFGLPKVPGAERRAIAAELREHYREEVFYELP